MQMNATKEDVSNEMTPICAHSSGNVIPSSRIHVQIKDPRPETLVYHEECVYCCDSCVESIHSLLCRNRTRESTCA